MADIGHDRGGAVSGWTGASGPASGDDPGDESDTSRAALREAAQPAQAADSAVLLGAADDERLRHHIRHC